MRLVGDEVESGQRVVGPRRAHVEQDAGDLARVLAKPVVEDGVLVEAAVVEVLGAVLLGCAHGGRGSRRGGEADGRAEAVRSRRVGVEGEEEGMGEEAARWGEGRRSGVREPLGVVRALVCCSGSGVASARRW